MVKTLNRLHLEATQKKNAGKTTLKADGTMEGYVAGLPFPDAKEPNKAQKIMWNYTYRWRGDDFSYPGGYVNATKRKGGKIGIHEGGNQAAQIFLSNRS